MRSSTDSDGSAPAATPTATLLLDATGRLLHHAANSPDLFWGREIAPLQGRPLADIASALSGDSQAQARQLAEELTGAAREGKPLETTYTSPASDPRANATVQCQATPLSGGVLLAQFRRAQRTPATGGAQNRQDKTREDAGGSADRATRQRLRQMRFAIKSLEAVYFEYDVATGTFYAFNDPMTSYDENRRLSLAEKLALTHPEDRDAITAAFDPEGRTLGEKTVVNLRQDNGQGGWRHCAVTVMPAQADPGGRITTFIGTRRDHSQRHQYRKMAHERGRLIELAMRNADLALWEYDRNADRFHLYPGAPAALPTDGNLQSLVDSIHESDKPKLAEPLRIVREGLDQAFDIEVQHTSIDSSGQWTRSRFLCAPCEQDKTGRCSKYIGFRINTTRWHNLDIDVQTTHELLNEITERMPCALFVKDIDDDLRYVMANRVFGEIVGCAPDEIVGKTDFDLLPRDDAERFRSHDYDVHQTGGPATFEEGFALYGRRYTHRVSKSALHTADGRNLLVTIGFDITELMNALSDLTRERDLAQQADRLKSAFLANISHEIRTPLNAIVGFSRLLPMATDDSKRERYTRIIEENNDLLLKMISDILDISRLESGTLPLRRERVSLSALVGEVAEALREMPHTPGIRLLRDDPPADAEVVADKKRLRQVLINFATNAVNNTIRGYIRVGCSRRGSMMRLYVEDSGVGIPAAKQDRLFRRFDKIDEFARGVGLGLALSKSLTEAMGGEVGFRSQEGAGSTFWAQFPAAPPAATE